ncbi:MAG TPA: TMEM175 family protein [Nitrososphaerales archaeon]|nr:TMEM175 family protein [Nitrososphaerales archaeon]
MEDSAKSGPRPRIESLSDLIFGLALSIGAFALVSSPPVTEGGFYKDIVTFGFNFIVLITVWLRYTRIMSALPVETRGTMALNTVLLFTVSLEPFIFNILRSPNAGNPANFPLGLYEAASSSYGLDLGAMTLILGVFTLALADEEKSLVPKEMLSRLRKEAATWFISAAVFFVSAVPLFGKVGVEGLLLNGISVRELMWLGAVLIAWARGSMISRVEARSETVLGTK